MSSFENPEKKWLGNGEAAKLLGVTARTVTRWLGQTETRDVIGAIRHGKQWRIPHPQNPDSWCAAVRRRLKKHGVASNLQRTLRRKARESGRWYLEALRLWLACYWTILKRDRVTTEAKEAICLLRQVAGEVLGQLQRHEMQIEKLKAEFAAAVLRRCSTKVEAQRVMRYWPNRASFEKVRTLHTFAKMEEFRRVLDYLQAVRLLEYQGKKPTEENIGPLLHKDVTTHINDLGEDLTGIVVKNPTGKELRDLALASVYGQECRPIIVDVRQAQDGLSRRTVQQRHPRRQKPQTDIIAAVYRIRANLPGAEEEPPTGKKPARGSDDD